MASRTKKAVAAGDTVTFKKADLVKKLKTFLENENACDGDWLNKVKVEFLGQKPCNVLVTVKIPATYRMEIACEGALPSKEEVAEAIRSEMDEGNFECFDYDESDFEVEKVEAVK